MATPKKPQDHQQKAKDKLYTFKVKTTDDKTGKSKERSYRLPPASAGADKVPGRALRNATMEGEEGQLALGFTLLELCGASQEAIDALYDLPTPKMLEHIEAWMLFEGEDDEDDAEEKATVPQSLRSAG